jgi:cysteine-rich repeat protein
MTPCRRPAGFAVVLLLSSPLGLAAESQAAAACTRGTLLPACLFYDNFESSGVCNWTLEIGTDLAICDVCGDGVTNVASGEQCDDGNVADGDGCSSTCQFEYCGNGYVDSANGEQCDDGNHVDTDGCRNNCQLPYCGDAVKSDSEICDTGGDSVLCDRDCTLPTCGDGLMNSAAGEQCDDGNVADGDGCSSSCKIESCPVT